MSYLNPHANAVEYQILTYAINFLFLSEFAICIYSLKGLKSNTKKAADRGTFWLIVACWCFCLMCGSVRGTLTGLPPILRVLLLPHVFFYIGTACILGGVLLRATAVLTLKKAFTLSVQTTDEQHIIQSGVYHFIRNPAYSGSILSLIGVALAFRNIISTLVILVLCLICYSIRIRVEERALAKQFPEEFSQYCERIRYRLIPLIY